MHGAPVCGPFLFPFSGCFSVTVVVVVVEQQRQAAVRNRKTKSTVGVGRTARMEHNAKQQQKEGGSGRKPLVPACVLCVCAAVCFFFVVLLRRFVWLKHNVMLRQSIKNQGVGRMHQRAIDTIRREVWKEGVGEKRSVCIRLCTLSLPPSPRTPPH